MPVPSPTSLVVKKGSKIRFITPGLMPIPVSFSGELYVLSRHHIRDNMGESGTKSMSLRLISKGLPALHGKGGVCCEIDEYLLHFDRGGKE